MRRRLGLLVSAVVTVTIPGVLAVLAILGHEHAVAGTTAMSAAGAAGESAVGPLPLAPASTRPGCPQRGRHGAAHVGRAR